MDKEFVDTLKENMRDVINAVNNCNNILMYRFDRMDVFRSNLETVYRQVCTVRQYMDATVAQVELEANWYNATDGAYRSDVEKRAASRLSEQDEISLRIFKLDP